MHGFSVVVPTYTGVGTVGRCLEAIAGQQLETRFELIIVQDGPNNTLAGEIRGSLPMVEAAGIDVTYHCLAQNRGRFVARLEGARLAKFEHVLFLDDRIDFGPSYFADIADRDEMAVMPRVYEKSAQNFVSRAIYLVRKHLLYRNHYETTENTHITVSNFESSPKGTTSLWVNRALFVEICEEIGEADAKSVNDDTRILRKIVESGYRIVRNGGAAIEYTPRGNASSELEHMFFRGPRFVDYYATPGRRYFPHLVLSGLLGVVLMGGAIVYPPALAGVLVLALLAVMALSLWMGESAADKATVFIGIPILTSAFVGGVLYGLVIAARGLIARTRAP